MDLYKTSSGPFPGDGWTLILHRHGKSEVICKNLTLAQADAIMELVERTWEQAQESLLDQQYWSYQY